MILKRLSDFFKKETVSKIIICILFIAIFYYFISYYLIYDKEVKEKKRISQIKQFSITEDDWEKHLDPYKEKSYLTNNSKGDSEKTDVDSDDTTTSFKPENWIGDCILSIPDIDLEKIVYTGCNREKHLENYELITASNNMKYSNGGNYIICGHASRLYGHSLNRLKEVKKGTKIQIQTKRHIDEYTVDQVSYENMNQTSKFCNQTIENTVTIISCAKYISKESYIVIHASKKE